MVTGIGVMIMASVGGFGFQRPVATCLHAWLGCGFGFRRPVATCLHAWFGWVERWFVKMAVCSFITIYFVFNAHLIGIIEPA